MKKFQKLKIIFFDVGNTLLYKKSIIDERIAKELGLSLKKLKEAKGEIIRTQAEKFQREFERMDTLRKQIDYFRKFYKRVLKYLKIKPTKNLIKKLLDYRLKEDLALKKGVIETLSYLKKKYELGVITGAFPSRRYYDLKTGSLYKYFDPIIITSEVGLRKQNPKIYEIAMEKAKVSPEETMFVDNKLKFLKAARKAGIKYLVLVNEDKKVRKKAKSLKSREGHLLVINEIKELINIL